LLDMPRPRRRADPALVSLKESILEDLDLSAAALMAAGL
jgi:hypothetical protein